MKVSGQLDVPANLLLEKKTLVSIR